MRRSPAFWPDMRRFGGRALLFAGLAFAAAVPVSAQTPGDPRAVRPTTPVVVTDPSMPAKDLFGRVGSGSSGRPEPIGFYSKGCLQGAVELPADGPNWQVMRPSRNRAWGHPETIAFIARMAKAVPAETGWPGLLVGDISQPRGGPMLTGHASHQLGLDVDLWLTPMPTRRLAREERETISAVKMVREDGLDIAPDRWTAGHFALVRMLARDPAAERVFVNAAIKKELCRSAGADRSWLGKVRPVWGHDYHLHVRLACPADAPGCEAQEGPPRGDGCDASLDWWFTDEALHPKPGKPRPHLKLADLPAACRAVLTR